MTILVFELHETNLISLRLVLKQTILLHFFFPTSSIANFALVGHNKNVHIVKLILIMH
jgi:hypothetical protein